MILYNLYFIFRIKGTYKYDKLCQKKKKKQLTENNKLTIYVRRISSYMALPYFKDDEEEKKTKNFKILI